MQSRRIRILLIATVLCAVGAAYWAGRQCGAPEARRRVQPEALAVPPGPPPPRSADEKPAAAAERIPESAHVLVPRTDTDLHSGGYDAALADLEEALSQIPRDRDAELDPDFVIGVFTYIAEHLPPAEAIRRCQAQEWPARDLALWAIVATWASSAGGLDEAQQDAARRSALEADPGGLGLEVQLAHLLAASRPDPDVVRAWIDGFTHHPGRSEMATRLLGDMVQDDPHFVFEVTNSWTTWERQRFETGMLEYWSGQEPEKAWDWYVERQAALTINAAPVILRRWAQTDTKGVLALLESVQDDDLRRAAVEAVATTLARQSSSDAVAWADELDDPIEKHAAFQRILEETPRGIGVAISYQDGFPTVQRVLPDSPSAAAGLVEGDRIVAVKHPDGSTRNLYGAGLQHTVEQLRGEAGSGVTVYVLRRDPVTAAITQHAYEITREQLAIEHPSPE